MASSLNLNSSLVFMQGDLFLVILKCHVLGFVKIEKQFIHF